MHRLPRLNWKTWVRLAFVEAGSDWRSLNKLAVEDGILRDYCLMPDNKWDNSLQYGVNQWEEPTGTIAAKSRPGNGRYAVADPRGPSQAFTKFAITSCDQDTGTVIGGHGPSHGAYGVADPRPDWSRRHNNMPVIDWNSPAKTIHQGGNGVQGGALSVADPRIDGHERSVQMGVRHWDQTAPVVTGKMFVGGGPNAIADPRIEGAPRFNNTYRIVPWEDASPAVAGPGGPAGGLAVSDPRAMNRVKGDNFLSGGHYGIIPWEASSGAISAAANHDNGRWSLADPRIDQPMPAPTDKLTCVIRIGPSPRSSLPPSNHWLIPKSILSSKAFPITRGESVWEMPYHLRPLKQLPALWAPRSSSLGQAKRSCSPANRSGYAPSPLPSQSSSPDHPHTPKGPEP